jgi:hypothetical protein
MASPAASYNMPMRDPPVLGQYRHALAGISKCRCGCHASYASNRSAHATCRVRLEDRIPAAGSHRSLVRGLGGGRISAVSPALAATSGPRRRSLDSLELNIGHENANDRARDPVRAIGTLQFWLLV